MHFRRLFVVLLGAALILGCDDDNGAPATPTSQPSAMPAATQVVEATATPAPQATPAPREVTGLFTDPQPRLVDRTVNVPPRPSSPFQPWDRESVVVYDVETGTERNFGPGYVASISPDETRLAYNVMASGRPSLIRIVEPSTGEVLHEIESSQQFGTFVDDDYLYLPGVGTPQAYDLRNQESVAIADIPDPLVRKWLSDIAASVRHELIEEGRYRLWRDNDAACQGKPDREFELCRAEAFERWVLGDAETGMPVLTFRAYRAGPAGPGELVIATSPQCEAPDGGLVWCADAHGEIRFALDAGEKSSDEVHGTTNIFIVDIETGAAEFVATASFSATAFYSWPQNWPLAGNQDHIIWTGSFCSQESPSNTHIYNRATGEVTELNVSLWVAFTATGDVGVDPFGPKAVLDIETLDWNIVLPDEVVDVGESSGGRYLYVGGVLGHGGLC